MREIIVGRDSHCDIYMGSQCQFVSKRHGSIYMDGSQLMYRDFSTNGTLINNVMVRNRAVSIHQGDVIMLAGRYPLAWSQINSFFSHQPPPLGQYYQEQTVSQPVSLSSPAEPDTTKWNWGAFGLYPLWGFWNGCWWGILICIFLGCFWPIPNIFFGIYGSQWAWENKTWRSIEDYEAMQRGWNPWGIFVFILNLLSLFVWIPFLWGLLMVYTAYL